MSWLMMLEFIQPQVVKSLFLGVLEERILGVQMPPNATVSYKVIRFTQPSDLMAILKEKWKTFCTSLLVWTEKLKWYIAQPLCGWSSTLPPSLPSATIHLGGRGNSTVVSVSVCQAGCPGSRLARSACFRKVEFYQCAIDDWFNKGRPCVIMSMW